MTDKEQDAKLKERIRESVICPKCENDKQPHREYCWLCTSVGDEDGK